MSAGKFTGLMYDPEAYSEQVARSTDPMLYRLDPNFAINCGRCFAPYGPRGGQQGSDAIGQQIDIDSVLRGVNQSNTRSNKQQMPHCLKGFDLIKKMDCPDGLEAENTRFTHPAYDIRGLTTRDLRFNYPLFDPQCQIFENFGINTKLQAKDSHRAVWQIPFNQRDLFPTERLGKVKNCCTQTNCNYAPYTS